jgi:hypothetical protein
MSSDRWPLQLLFTEQCVLNSVQQDGGRPLKTRIKHVRADLESIGASIDWWRKCKDRVQWRKATQKVLLNIPTP